MSIKADLLLPVYNSPHLLQNLFESLIAFTDPQQVGELLIGDDGSDEKTQTVIQSFQKRSPFPVKVVRREKNVGFLKNCNELFKLSASPLAVLINSDILFPPGWISRIIAPFLKDEKIAMATPFSTSAANLTVRMPIGCSWMDLDRVFQSLPAHYPPACTAVGFCVAIRRSAVKRPQLFDEFFGEGYGEETDLHYELLGAGLKSVVVDNLLIHHVGSGSFSLLPSLDERKKKNYDLFIERWGKVHFPLAEEFVKNREFDSKVELKTNRSRWTLPVLEYDVLFVLPIINEKSGGVQVVVELTERLIAMGYRANIVDLGDIDHHYIEKVHFFSPLRPRDLDRVKKAQVVLSTHFLTVSEAKKISKQLGAEFVYFLQGPEGMFCSGMYYTATVADFASSKNILCVSDFLVNYVKEYATHSKIKTIGHGPDPLFFYPRSGAARRPKSIAGCLRLFPEKGTGYLFEFLSQAKKRGYEIHLFGQETDRFELLGDFATIHGDLSRQELSRLFSQVEFYADFSFFEGLGLLPLEAAFCGAVPIVSKTGGSNFIFDQTNSIFMNNIFELQPIWDQLESLSPEKWSKMSQSAQDLANRFSFRLSIPRMTGYFKTELSIVPSPVSPFQPVRNEEILTTFLQKVDARIAEFMRKVGVALSLFRQGGWKKLVGRSCFVVAKRLGAVK